jgi:putative SOS response-associated peptidase YedK
MCNLYSLNSARESAGKLFKVSHNRMAAFEPQLTLFPGYMAPVIRLASDGERELVNLSWGFVLLMDGKAPRRVTNVRDDKIRESAFWKGSFQERRCLVPASSFCEPKGAKPATWNWFALNGDEPRPLFAFAGIWRTYKGTLKKGGETVEQDIFAFLTTTPNKLVATINHERMPVILTKEEEFRQWLAGSNSEAYSLVRQYPAQDMRIVQQGQDKQDRLEA